MQTLSGDCVSVVRRREMAMSLSTRFWMLNMQSSARILP